MGNVMNYTIFISVLYGTVALGAATRPALVEGEFIIRNKHRNAKLEIQELKKELTACLTGTAEKASNDLETYHCKLKELLYPSYIDELSRVITYAEKQLPQLQNDEVPQQVLDEAVQRAGNLLKKLENEKKLLAAIFEVDMLEKQVAIIKKNQATKGEQFSTVADLEKSIKQKKQQVLSLKKECLTINSHLFRAPLSQEVFLDKLAYYTA